MTRTQRNSCIGGALVTLAVVGNFMNSGAVPAHAAPAAPTSTVTVSNFPNPQAVSGTVAVSNFPATQTVGFSTPPNVNIGNTTANPVPASPAMPANPFLQELVNAGTPLQSFGPGTGTLAVTSLTFTNFDSLVHVIRIFQPVLSGGSPGFCQGNSVIGGSQGVRVLVPSNQTVHLALPAPEAFNVN